MKKGTLNTFTLAAWDLRHLTGAGKASESGGHEGQPSPGGRYNVHVGLSWPHGCLVAMVFSPHQTTRAAIIVESPLVGWALGLGSFSAKEEDGSTWGQFCPLELKSISSHYCTRRQG